jgi:hypothetical protein
MSASVTERARTSAGGGVRARTTPIPGQRDAPAPDWGTGAEEPGRSTRKAGRKSTQKSTQRAALKAYARRDERVQRLTGAGPARTAASTGRPQFVLLIMVLLVVGLAATLWLSTAAAADSYRLQDARAAARELSERAERLHREVAVLESAPELARRAAAMGMVPVQNPARLVVAPDGSVTVVGEPRAAVAPPPPAPVVVEPRPAAEGPNGPAQEGAAPNGAAPNGAAPNGAGPNGPAQDGAAPDSAGPGGVAQNAASTGQGAAGTQAESAPTGDGQASQEQPGPGEPEATGADGEGND